MLPRRGLSLMRQRCPPGRREDRKNERTGTCPGRRAGGNLFRPSIMNGEFASPGGARGKLFSRVLWRPARLLRGRRAGRPRRGGARRGRGEEKLRPCRQACVFFFQRCRLCRGLSAREGLVHPGHPWLCLGRKGAGGGLFQPRLFRGGAPFSLNKRARRSAAWLC